MRRQLNKLLRKSGYEIQKIGRAIYLLEKLVKKKGEIAFIQVGANDGISFDNIFSFFIDHPCSGLVIEPLPNYFERLCLNYRDYPRITPLNIALHPSDTQSKIFSVRPDRLQNYPHWLAGIASFDKQHLLQQKVAEADVQAVSVPCESLMSIVEKYGLAELDYLQVDTEGFDYEIIKMIDFSRIKPSIIKFESVHLKSGQKNELHALLVSQGYKLIQEPRDTVAYLP